MDKTPNHIAFLPFEELLSELKEQYHFVLGVDSHERINRLLNRYAMSESPDARRLQYELCALLAGSQEEQDIFDRSFQEFLDRYSFELEKKEVDSSVEISKKISRSRLFFRAFSFLLLLVSLYIYLAFVYVKPIPGPVFAQLPGSYHMFLADTSEVRDLPPLFIDKVKERYWQFKFENYKEAKPRLIIPFSEPLAEGVQFRIVTQSNKERQREVKLRFQEPLRVRIEEKKKDSERVFVPQIIGVKAEVENWPDSLREAYQDVAASYQLLGRSYLWKLSDGRQFEESEISLADPEQSLQLRLEVIAYWLVDGDTLSWEASASTEISPPHPATRIPFVPIGFKYLEGPDINKVKSLIQSMKPHYLPFYLLLLGLTLYLLYEWYRFRRRKLILEPSKKIGSPLRVDLEIEPSGWPKFDDPKQEEALLSLRIRQLGLGEKLDIPATLEATVEAGAIPAFRYEARSQAPHYLFLIEEKSSRDHFALYFSAWVAEMNRRDITAECYFYRRSPHKCWRIYSDRDSHRSLGQLLSVYSDYRIVVVGEAQGLFDLRSGKPGEIIHQLENWHQKALLTPSPISQWAHAEKSAQEYLPVLPANSEGLLQLSRIWSEEEKLNKLSPKSLLDPELPILPDDPVAEEKADWPAVVEELRPYLGVEAMQWLAATAIYTELEWELTLNLGRALGFYYEEQSGLRIFRLPWFRQGALPEGLREALYDELSPQQRADALAYLTSLLAHRENMPPPNSLAEQERRSQVAMYHFLQSDQGATARAALQQVIRSLPPEEIQDPVVLKGLASATPKPLMAVLPRQMFHKQMPYFGLRSRTRAVAFGIAALLFSSIWVLLNGNPLAKGLPKAPYTENMMRTGLTERDSLTWAHYRAWQAADTGNYEQALQIFDRRIVAFLEAQGTDSDELAPLARDHSRAMYNVLLQQRNEIGQGLKPPFGVDSKVLSRFSYLYSAYSDPIYRQLSGLPVYGASFWQSYMRSVTIQEARDNKWLLANSYVYYGDDWDALIIDQEAKTATGYLSPFIDFKALLDSAYFDRASAPNAFFDAGTLARDSLILLLDYLEGQIVAPVEQQTIDSIRRVLGVISDEKCRGNYVIEGYVREQTKRTGLEAVAIRWGREDNETRTNKSGYFKLALDTCKYPLSDFRLELSRKGYRDTLWYIVPTDAFYETFMKASLSDDKDPHTEPDPDRSIKGRVTLISSGNKAVTNAEVYEMGYVSTRTDEKGNFELIYGDPEETRKTGALISLQVDKKGLEVVNTDALKAKLGQMSLVRIFMAPLGYVDSLERAYYNTLMNAIDKAYRTEVQGLQDNRKMNTYEVQQKTQVIDRVRNNRELEAASLARQLARTNIDQVSREKGYAILALQKGDGSLVMDLMQDSKVQQKLPEDDFVQNKKSQTDFRDGQSSLDKAMRLLSEYKYKEAMESFNQAVGAEPGNITFYLDFGERLEKAGRSDEAILVYKQAIQYGNPTVEQQQILANRLSDVHAKSGDYINAIYVQKNFLNRLKEVQNQDPEKYDLMFIESTLRIADYYQYQPKSRDGEYLGLLRSARRLILNHRKYPRYKEYKARLDDYWKKSGEGDG